MKILIVTQNDQLYLNHYINDFLHALKINNRIIAVGILDPSPFGKRMNFYQKALQTLNIFGLYFFLRYSILYVFRKLTTKSVYEICKVKKVECFEIEGDINSQVNLLKMQEFAPDLIISLSANQIFRSRILTIPKRGTINLHCSKLPKYRGLFPSFWALLHNEKYSAATVFFVDSGIDSGQILIQRDVKITNRNLEWLIKETKTVGLQALLEAVQMIEQGGFSLAKNDDQIASYFSFPTRQDVEKFKASGARLF